MKWRQKNLKDGENYDLYFVGDGNPLCLQSVAHVPNSVNDKIPKPELNYLTEVLHSNTEI